MVGSFSSAGARLGARHRPYLIQIGWRELWLTLLRGDRGGGVHSSHDGCTAADHSVLLDAFALILLGVSLSCEVLESVVVVIGDRVEAGSRECPVLS